MHLDLGSQRKPVLSLSRAEVHFDGTFSTPKLSHPECVCIGPDGWVWVGNHDGDICRISPDGTQLEKVASTGGFCLGMAFERDRALFVCDLKHGCIFRLELATGTIERFADGGIRIPNYPLVDPARNRLLVSDSFKSGEAGPGLWAYDLETGQGGLWCDEPFNFANGLAMRDGEDALYVCETFTPAIARVPILADGTAGQKEIFAKDLPGLPDGIAFDDHGSLIVGCYEPSRLLRISADGTQTQILIEDETAHVLCHPTNIAFDGTTLYTANLGRWHVTKVQVDVGAPALWRGVP
jgi:gluconolactonase